MGNNAALFNTPAAGTASWDGFSAPQNSFAPASVWPCPRKEAIRRAVTMSLLSAFILAACLRCTPGSACLPVADGTRSYLHTSDFSLCLAQAARQESCSKAPYPSLRQNTKWCSLTATSPTLNSTLCSFTGTERGPVQLPTVLPTGPPGSSS